MLWPEMTIFFIEKTDQNIEAWVAQLETLNSLFSSSSSSPATSYTAT